MAISKPRDKRGVSGLLLFFIITLILGGAFYIIVLGAVFFIGALAQVTYTANEIIYFLLELAVSAFFIKIGIDLLRYKSEAVRWAKYILVISFLVEVLGAFMVPKPGTDAMAIWIAFAYGVIWFSYLSVSKRVKNTYVSNPRKFVISKAETVTYAVIIGVAQLIFLYITLSPLFVDIEFDENIEFLEDPPVWADVACNNYCLDSYYSVYYAVGQHAETREYYCYCVDEDSYPLDSILLEDTGSIDDPVICEYNAYNCADFISQGEAQAVFEWCGGMSNDIHYLDGDNDGKACESLP